MSGILDQKDCMGLSQDGQKDDDDDDDDGDDNVVVDDDDDDMMNLLAQEAERQPILKIFSKEVNTK
jgi:hypothetical protein